MNLEKICELHPEVNSKFGCFRAKEFDEYKKDDVCYRNEECFVYRFYLIKYNGDINIFKNETRRPR